MGGDDVTSYYNDVWSSTDGASWDLVTGNAAWSGRNYHSNVVHDNKIYVLGGYDGTSRFNDV